MTNRVVAVIGQGGDGVDRDVLAAAEVVGRTLAGAGATVVCGGLDGVMAAAALGARTARGTVVGILPGTDRNSGNPHLSVAIPTGMGEARNILIVRSADAIVAIGGGYGTLSEIGFALKASKPVIGLRTWELARGGRRDRGILIATTPEEAAALALAEGGAPTDR